MPPESPQHLTLNVIQNDQHARLLKGVLEAMSDPLYVIDVQTYRVVAAVLERLGRMIEEKQAQISVAEEWPLALGYAPWIEEIWMNYLSNALKYGSEPPVIELGATTLTDGRIRFWVRDNGQGLSCENYEL